MLARKEGGGGAGYRRPVRTEPDTLVDDVMTAIPVTIRVFMTHRMHCVGCAVGRFHTIADACRAHGIDLAAFMAEIVAASPAVDRR